MTTLVLHTRISNGTELLVNLQSPCAFVFPGDFEAPRVVGFDILRSLELQNNSAVGDPVVHFSSSRSGVSAPLDFLKALWRAEDGLV